MAHEEQILKALDKFERQLDSLDSRLDSVDKTLVKQEANLGEHMRRTELAETQINGIQDDLKPIKRHVAMVEGALKGMGIVATIISVAVGIIKILGLVIK